MPFTPKDIIIGLSLVTATFGLGAMALVQANAEDADRARRNAQNCGPEARPTEVMTTQNLILLCTDQKTNIVTMPTPA